MRRENRTFCGGLEILKKLIEAFEMRQRTLL
jgi:hypothetical protein